MKKIVKPVLIIAIIIIIGKLMIGSNSETAKSEGQEILQTENTSSPTIVDTSSINHSKWMYNEYVDDMTDKKTFTAEIYANEKLSFDFPYEGGALVTLTVRKDAGTDVFLYVSKGQFVNSYNHSIRIRFDDQKPFTVGFNEASDGSTNYIFLEAVSKIISGLKKARIMKVEVEFFNEGTRILTFDVSDFEWSH